MPQNYYAPDFDPWVHNIRNIGTMLAQIPALRAQAQLRQAQISEAGARTSEATAMAGEHEARAQDLIRKGKMVEDLQGVAGDAESALRAGNYDDPSVKQFTQLSAALMGVSGKDAQLSMRNGIQTIEAMKGNARKAGLLQNPASVANNEANNERIMDTPMNVPQGATAIDKRTGSTVALGTQKLGIGQRLFMPRVDDGTTIDSTPAASGPDAPPKTPMMDAIRARTLGQALLQDAKNNPGTNSVASDVMSKFDSMAQPTNPAPAAALPKFSSADDVKAAYKAGKLDRNTAAKILQQQFGLQ